MNEHWLDKRIRENRETHLTGNTIRMSAATIAKLIAMKNAMLGSKKSIFEASVDAEEQGAWL